MPPPGYVAGHDSLNKMVKYLKKAIRQISKKKTINFQNIYSHFKNVSYYDGQLNESWVLRYSMKSCAHVLATDTQRSIERQRDIASDAQIKDVIQDCIGELGTSFFVYLCL